jgi:hypothetical protein
VARPATSHFCRDQRRSADRSPGLGPRERSERRRHREGLKLGGLSTAAVGIGLMIFLRAVQREEPVYLVRLIPLLVGGALLAYVLLFAGRE